MNLDDLPICLIMLDDSTVVDPRSISAMTCESYPAGGHVTRIYLEGSYESIRVTMPLEDVLAKIKAGITDVLEAVRGGAKPQRSSAGGMGPTVSGGGSPSASSTIQMLGEHS